MSKLYVIRTGDEIIVCAEEDLEKTISEYFTKADRNIEDSDIVMCSGAVHISSRLKLDSEPVKDIEWADGLFLG